MRIIPVLDIMHGTTVHAIRGQRKEYRPLVSEICPKSRPVELARCLKEKFAFDEMYAADLDAITGRGDNTALLARINSIFEGRLMVDAGIADAAKARSLLNAGLSSIVVGTETLEHLAEVGSIGELPGLDRLIVSLDFKNGRLLTRCRSLRGVEPEFAAKKFEALGAEELLEIELSRVGSGMGPDFDLVRKTAPVVNIPVLAGGGIRSISDILQLEEIGASGTLVATALHKRGITKQDLDLVRGQQFPAR